MTKRQPSIMRLGSPRARKVSKREATDKPSNQVTKTRNGGVGNPMTLLHATIVDLSHQIVPHPIEDAA